MIFLRQSTATQVVWLGPFVDTTGAPVTSLSIANTDIRIRKQGATTSVAKNSGGATSDANGRYFCTFDATDTDTLGSGRVDVTKTGALTVWETFVVLPPTVYDAMLAGTGAGIRAQIPAGSIATDAIDANSIKADAVTEIQAGLMLAASYTAPNNAGIAHISTVIDTLPTTAPDNAGIASIVAAIPAGGIASETLVIAAVQTVLDTLGTPALGTISHDLAAVDTAIATRQATFTAAVGVSFPLHFGSQIITAGGVTASNIVQVNSIVVTGSGTVLDPWRPE